MNINWNDPNFQGFGRQPRPKKAVSYTHLTLPTIS